MNIISHRGFWRTPNEKNTSAAFARSFDAGFGIETDLRDAGGQMVIAHDMPRGGEASLSDLLHLLARRNLPLAINIKSDGLAAALLAQMQEHGLTRWYTFDMSVPEMVVQVRRGLPVFTRVSEYEPRPALYEQAAGVWVDGFVGDWVAARDIATFLRDGKQVTVVSPELHGRSHLALWNVLGSPTIKGHPELTLCTDMPDFATAFFGKHT